MSMPLKAEAGGSSKGAGVEQLVLAIIASGPEGILQQDILQHSNVSHFTTKDCVGALNSLLHNGKVTLLTAGKDLYYKLAQASAVDAKLKGLNAEEMLVYQVIKQAGNTGVWTKDMKMRTNLAQPQISKFLKVLEGRNLIKSVKNVNNPSRKLYMLYELEPSREITGGAWYTENQFDSEFIEVLRETCYRLVQMQDNPHASLADITAFINSRGLSRVELQTSDIQQIMDTLVYDGRVEAIEAELGQPDRYRPVVLQLPATTAFTSLPCGVCPVFHQCVDGGEISPQTCVYYQAWLDF